MKSFREYITESFDNKKLYQLTQKEVLKIIDDLTRAKKTLRSIPKWEQQENFTKTDEQGNEYTVFTPKYEKAKKEFESIRQIVVTLFDLKGTKYNKYAAGPKQLDSQQQAERLSDKDAIKLHKIAIQNAQKKGIKIDPNVLKDL